MKKSLGFAILGLSASAVLASGSVYAAYVLTDNANPFGVKISITRQAGYYLMGDASITGDPDLAWDIAGGIPLTDGVPVELALPAEAQFKVAYFANGTIAENSWYNALADTYPFASNEDNVKVLYARTYQITFDETEKKISIADKNPAPYADYKDNYFIKVGDADPIASGDPGNDNEGKWLNVEFDAPATVAYVHSTNGYALDTGVYKDSENNVLANDSFQISEAGTYNIYLNKEMKTYIDKQSPALTGITATIDGNPIELTDIKTGGSNKAEYEITLSAGQTIAFKDNGTDIHFYHWDGQAKDDGIAYTATKTGIHKFYYNDESQMYVGQPADTMTITISVASSMTTFGDVPVYLHYWGGSAGSSWPGVAMTGSGTTWTLDIPNDMTYVIVSRYNSSNPNSPYNQTVDIELNGHTSFTINSWADKDGKLNDITPL